jgi:endonuclease III related protein
MSIDQKFELNQETLQQAAKTLIGKQLIDIFSTLYQCYGSQRWWPGDNSFEICIGAILTQNTNWQNVHRAIQNLKSANALDPHKILTLPESELAELIKPSGYFNIKAKKLKHFCEFLLLNFGFENGEIVEKPEKISTSELRRKLLAVWGIGDETADDILLYAFDRNEIFVVDAYTIRIMSRHNLIYPKASYDDCVRLFTENLHPIYGLFNEYHALLVKVGKNFCLKSKPRCEACPLNSFL